MREIKFRAWGSQGQGMFLVEEIDFQDMSVNEGLTGAVLMQYTGLIDRNGNKIYEGDIVVWVTDVVVGSEGGFNRTEPEGQIGSVEFSNGAFFVNSKEEFYSYGEQNFLWSELEIIGNIYENQDLIVNK